MKVFLANPRGFCAGVERAIEIVERAIDKHGAPIYVRHEVVHNRFVVEDLKKKGAIFVDEITYRNDSVRIQTPVFEGYIIAKIEDNFLKGSFIKTSLDRIVPFEATKNNVRFSSKKEATKNISGNWETVFNENSADEKYIAKGIFNQNLDASITHHQENVYVQ